jgi:APA family basic amino acid/polyamine antiporter
MSATSSPSGTEAQRHGAAPSAYARQATGMVREIPLLDTLLYSAYGPGGIGIVLTVALFYAFGSFPGGNLTLGLVIALPLVALVWICFALMSSAFPRTGGDYVFGSRVLHPVAGLASNLGVFVSTLLACGLWAIYLTTLGLGPAFAAIGTVTGNGWWLDAATTITQKGWSLAFAVLMIVIMSLLSIIRTRVVTRVATVSYIIGTLGFFIAFFILLFSSNEEFRTTINEFSAPLTGSQDTYGDTIANGREAGLVYPSESGYSTENTIGMLVPAFGVLLWSWWATYLAGEMRGAGQRRRQLTAMLGGGYFSGVLILLGALVFTSVAGYEFFAAANAGGFPVEGVTPWYNFFAALVAGSDFLAVLLSLMFLGFLIPGAYINFSMCQRALFAWTFDGLGPRKLASVTERTHTPVVSILVVAIGAAAAAVWLVYESSVLQVLTITGVLLALPMAVTALSAIALSRRLPHVYSDSPANWRVGGLSVLTVTGYGTLAITLVYFTLVCWFHDRIGISSAVVMPLMVPAAFAVAAIWYFVARRVQRGRGVDLDLVYKTIPPD